MDGIGVGFKHGKLFDGKTGKPAAPRRPAFGISNSVYAVERNGDATFLPLVQRHTRR
jgi:hypothetical protein